MEIATDPGMQPQVTYIMEVNGHPLLLDALNGKVICNHKDCTVEAATKDIEGFTIGRRCQLGPQGLRYDMQVVAHAPTGRRKEFLKGIQS